MIHLEIHYQPIARVPWYRRIRFTLPASWEEINPRQLLSIVRLYKNKLSELKFMARMCRVKSSVIAKLEPYQRFKLSEQLDFLSEKVNHYQFIIPRLSICLASPFRPLIHYYAPKDKLKGITFGQFVFLEHFYTLYHVSQKESDLDKFLCCLYLKKGEIFSETVIEKRHRHFSRLKPELKEAIYLNYQLIHEWLSMAYPLIFHSSTKENDKKETQTPPPVPDSNQWLKVFQSLVDEDILHDDQYASKPLNTILSFMTRQYKKQAKSKK